ncbi:AAA family ATPase [Nocardia sp. NPDC006630]|uniref:AAA family ATPase n=1 Tax=Nocardia sp. NPDC006630 TaxID=3157181 RepID=UPI0033B6E541
MKAFVGRAHELTSLDAVYSAADGPWVFLVEGPAGIGKSRLLGELSKQVGARAVQVVSVPATEFEESTPLQLIRDILEQFPDADTAALDRDPSGADARELARLLRRRLGAAPAMLIIDDAHWADAASLRVLALLIRSRPDASTRVVLAYREGQFPALLGHTLRAIGSATFHLLIPPLSPADAAALLPGIPSGRRDRLLTASHGNPLYLLLLARLTPAEFDAAVHEDDPAAPTADHSALDRTIRAELVHLPRRERLVAQAAAVCGPTADAELLCATAELNRTELTAGIDELARRGWLTVTGGTVTFRHPLIRTAAYRLAGHGWRAEAHARAARTLRAADAPLLTRARHLEHALCGGDEEAVADLLRAAEQTLATAPATSARWIAAALQAAPHQRDSAGLPVRLLLGRALLLSGTAESARAVLEPLAAQPGPQQTDALLLYARCERILGNVDTARNLLATAADRPGATGNGPVQLELAILELQDNRDAEGAERVRALFDSDAVSDPAIRAAALTLRSMGQLAGLDMTAATTSYRAAEREFAQLTDAQVRDGVHAVSALGWMAYFLDDHRTGIAHIERAIRISRRFGQSFILPELHTVQAYSLAKLGRFEESLAAAEDAAESAELFGYPDVPPLAGTIKLRVLEATSPRAEVLRWWRIVDAMPRPVMRWWRAVVDAALSETAARLGAGDANITALQPDRAHPTQPTELAARTQAAIAQGALDTAATLVAQAEAAAHKLGLPGQSAAAAQARAEYASARGDLAAAGTAVQIAIEEFGRAAMPVQRGQALLLAAQLAGRGGDFTRATAAIAAARADFTAAGAFELLVEATAVQRRLAGHQTVSGAGELTEREREVADLAACGRTNKEIAAQLYLSPRTVEDHLSRILRKLGLTSRAGIAHRLAELDAAPAR